MSTEPRSIVPGAALAGVGGLLLLIGVVWMSVIGYYPDQLPIIVVLVAAGLVLVLVGQRMYQSAKRDNAVNRIDQRDNRGA